MSLKSLADTAVAQVEKTVSTPLTESEVTAISKIVENALIEAVNHSAKHYAEAAVVCCGHEADLAHKIAEEVDRAQSVLITNLMAMR